MDPEAGFRAPAVDLMLGNIACSAAKDPGRVNGSNFLAPLAALARTKDFGAEESALQVRHGRP